MKQLQESLLDDESTLMHNTSSIKYLLLNHCTTESHFIYKNGFKKDPILEEKFDKIFTIHDKIVDINLLKANKVKNISIYIDSEFLKNIKIGNCINEYSSGAIRINCIDQISLFNNDIGLPNSITGNFNINVNNIKTIDLSKVNLSNNTCLYILNRDYNNNDYKSLKFSNNNFKCLTIAGCFNIQNLPNVEELDLDTFAACSFMKAMSNNSIKYIYINQ